MAIVTILIGSVVGLIIGLVGVVFFGMPLLTAFWVYLLCGVGSGILTTGYIVTLCALSSRSQATAA